jgi:hypothetical protein
VVVKLYQRRGDGSYYSEPVYIFRPIVDNQGNYEIKLDYTDQNPQNLQNLQNFQNIFIKGDYRVEYGATSNTATTKIGSYLATITDDCNQPKPVIVQDSIEIAPDGKVTVRTGGGSELYFMAITLVLVLVSYGWWRLKRKEVVVGEVFEG